MQALPSLDQIDPKGAVVLVRVDYNLPMKNGNVLDHTRILRTMQTIQWLCDHQAKVILLTHLGRPAGKPQKEFSLKLILETVEAILGKNIYFCPHLSADEIKKTLTEMAPGSIMLLENLRFDPREEENSPQLAKVLASSADFYVNEAFSVSHRAHCSTHALAKELPTAAGFAFAREVSQLSQAFSTPEKPVVALLGGAKISSKIRVIESLLAKVDHLLIGGNMAHFFLHVKEQLHCKNTQNADDMTLLAAEILQQDEAEKIILPVDGVIEENRPRVKAWAHVRPEDWVFDIGPASVDHFCTYLSTAKTILWNGPVGKIETPPYDQASLALARAIAGYTKAGAFSVAGGGETLSVLTQAGVSQEFSYTSTAGGAFLNFLEGETLPGISALL